MAKRLQVREVEIIRFALQLTFTKLAALYRHNACGQDLIPVFLEFGPELMHHFNMDSQAVERVINGDLDDSHQQVDSHDIELMTLSQVMPAYHFHSKLKGLPKLEAGRLDLSAALQQYLYQKYIHADDTSSDSDFDSEVCAAEIKEIKRPMSATG